MEDPIITDSAPFLTVSRHDGRLIRAPGLAALAGHDPGGGYTAPHFELCGTINLAPRPDPSHWTWALSQGLGASQRGPGRARRMGWPPLKHAPCLMNLTPYTALPCRLG